MKKLLITLISAIFLVGGFSLGNYSAEQENAYNYALSQNITTASSIEKADMNESLTRIAMAKMISNFAINVLGLQPDTSKSCQFPDIPSSLDYQYDNGVTKACQLGLMGVGISQFYPNGKVTRAEFGTVLSRAVSQVYGKIVEDGDPYYVTHLEFLQSEGIIKSTTNPSPSTVERRGNVMIMMMRASELNKDANIEIEIIPEDNQSQKISTENLAKLKDKGVIRGSKDAKITIVEFTELLCPYCQRQSQQGIINSVIQQFSGQVNSISRPFIIHGDIALQLSLATECVGELKPGIYHETLDKAFESYPINIDGLIEIAVDLGVNRTSLETCINEGRYNQSITDIMELGSQIGVNGTPSSIVINNETREYKIIVGAYPIEYFIEAVESLL